jgi:hypothetical protein
LDWTWQDWSNAAAFSPPFYYGQTRAPIWKPEDEESAELLYARFLVACGGAPLSLELKLSSGSLWNLSDEGSCFYEGNQGPALPIFENAEAASMEELLLAATGALSSGSPKTTLLLLHAGRSVEVRAAQDLRPSLEAMAPSLLRRAKRNREEA